MVQNLSTFYKLFLGVFWFPTIVTKSDIIQKLPIARQQEALQQTCELHRECGQLLLDDFWECPFQRTFTKNRFGLQWRTWFSIKISQTKQLLIIPLIGREFTHWTMNELRIFLVERERKQGNCLGHIVSFCLNMPGQDSFSDQPWPNFGYLWCSVHFHKSKTRAVSI